MKILKVLQKESGFFLPVFIGLGLLSGTLNALLIPAITFVIEKYGESKVFLTRELLLFSAYILITVLIQRTFSKYLVKLTQKIIFKIRLDILEKVRLANFKSFENIGKEKIYASITRDASIVSANASQIVYLTTSVITIVGILIYILTLSWIAFVGTLITMLIGVLIYYIRQRIIFKDLDEARNLENSFFKYIDEMLAGFKEIKVDKKKNEDLFNNYVKKVSIETRDLNTRSLVRYLDNTLMSNLSLFALITFILFVLPNITGDFSEIFKIITIVLYIIGPIGGVMTVIPGITQANISMRHIEELNKKASEIIEKQEDFTEMEFQSLELEEVFFQYESEHSDPFSIGPINLMVKKGEFIFIAGGNGSGKTTMFKILTGLYKPVSGIVRLNGKPIDNYAEYRSVFSPIYSDFHLFERLYGQSKVSDEKVNEYIRLMELEEKVTYQNGAFSQTSLSTGQRKRLALIASLLENKPVLVLDEWAADQDPVFRKFFYNNILTDLKKSGKTIIAITHDDNYFHVADKLYKMEYGKLSKNQ